MSEKLEQTHAEWISATANCIHMNARAKGWWDTERNDGEMIALIHSELSEALEYARKGNPPDDKVPELSGVAAELADTVIRIMDLCVGRGIDLGQAIVLKHNFNTTREYKHGKKF